jgi:hypothetical protein
LEHPRSFPPVVINITDGEPADRNTALEAARRLGALKTNDGNVLLLNAHISEHRAAPIALPDAPDSLPNDYSRLLFEMSSILPPPLRASAEAQGFGTSSRSRGFVYNADVETLVRVLTFGSTPQLNR